MISSIKQYFAKPIKLPVKHRVTSLAEFTQLCDKFGYTQTALQAGGRVISFEAHGTIGLQVGYYTIAWKDGWVQEYPPADSPYWSGAYEQK